MCLIIAANDTVVQRLFESPYSTEQKSVAKLYQHLFYHKPAGSSRNKISFFTFHINM
jgi:hypothetical protein